MQLRIHIEDAYNRTSQTPNWSIVGHPPMIPTTVVRLRDVGTLPTTAAHKSTV